MTQSTLKRRRFSDVGTAGSGSGTAGESSSSSFYFGRQNSFGADFMGLSSSFGDAGPCGSGSGSGSGTGSTGSLAGVGLGSVAETDGPVVSNRNPDEDNPESLFREAFQDCETGEIYEGEVAYGTYRHGRGKCLVSLLYLLLFLGRPDLA